MARILLSATLVGTSVLAVPAYAADLGCDCAAPLPLPPAAMPGAPFKVAPWAGPYVGVSFALINNSVRQSENGPGDWPAAYGERYQDNYSATTGRIGIHAGYALQSGAAVFGVEADVGKLLGGETHIGLVTGNDSFRPDWDASARIRAGFVAGDTTLFYGTGGISLANVRLKLDEASAGSNTHIGWTGGVGVELMLTDKVLGRIETRYTDYGGETYQTIHGPIRMDFDDRRLSVGVSHKF